MTKSFTPRGGFPIYTFLDFYREDCSIELSSLADARCIWFGRDSARMHLSVAQVKELLPILQRFVETEDINDKPNG